MPVGGVQPQHPAANLVPRVERVAELGAKVLGLRLPERRQLASPLEDEERLFTAAGVKRRCSQLASPLEDEERLYCHLARGLGRGAAVR